MKRLARPVFFAAAVVLAPSWAEPPATAREDAPDLVVVGGRIFTADPARPWAEGLAVRAGRIVAVGRSAAILRADLAVLSQDPFAVPARDLPRTESVLTLIGGRVVYDAAMISQPPERSAP